MTSKIKVDNINKVSDDSNIIKKCGTTTTIGSGASNPIVVDGSAITLGRCGGTVALASGATQTGFGRTGTVDWQTGSIKTATFTAANGEGYFANTSGGAFTMNLPAGTAGNIVSVVDYTNTFQTNALTIAPNGSQKIGGVAATNVLNTEGQSVTFVYVDDTEGWKNVQDSTSNITGNPNLSASVTGCGNTLSTAPCCANIKIATFTGPGSFIVNGVSQIAAENTVGYMVVGGGGGASSSYGGGGGAGGFREGRNVPIDNFTASPLVANAPTNAVTVTAQSYPITVGSGGASGSPNAAARTGSNSIFSTITSAGGGGGGSQDSNCATNAAGGSGGGSGGGGSGGSHPGGAGNTPPVSPSQGFNGGSNTQSPAGPAGGGGGASAVGASSPNGYGGNGVTNSITGSPVTRAGGGGGGGYSSGPASGGTGGGGAGGRVSPPVTGSAGSVNTGGGAGSGPPGNTGGSGIVIIRYKFQ